MASDFETSTQFSSVFVACFFLTSSCCWTTVSGNEHVCLDGVYQIEQNINGLETCCQCAPGQHLISDCTKSAADRECQICDRGYFNPFPNHELNCHRCSSCSHPNENLEEETPCTPAKDATCRCKQNHFCRSKKEEKCLLCHPCTECGSEGIKHKCSFHNDTICNENAGGSNTTIIVAVLLSLIVVGVCLAFVAYWLWKKRQTKGKSTSSHPESGNETEMETFINVDLRRHLQDIVDVLGWSDMQDVALKSSVNQTVIDFCKKDHQGDSREQTRELLKTWIEHQGMAASQNLIETLEKMNKRGKVEKIKVLLKPQD